MNDLFETGYFANMDDYIRLKLSCNFPKFKVSTGDSDVYYCSMQVIFCEREEVYLNVFLK